MKKVYSKKLGAEAYALAPEQLDLFEQLGYGVPAPGDVIADAGAATIEPPAGARAYVVMNLKTGEFAVRVRGCTLKGKDTSAFTGELAKALVLKSLVERADPDRPREHREGADKPGGLSGLLLEALKRAAGGVQQPGAASVVNLREVEE